MRAGTDRAPRRRHRPGWGRTGSRRPEGDQTEQGLDGQDHEQRSPTGDQRGEREHDQTGEQQRERSAAGGERTPRRGGRRRSRRPALERRHASARATTASSWVATTTAEPGGADRVEDPDDGRPGEPVLADRRLVGEDQPTGGGPRPPPRRAAAAPHRRAAAGRPWPGGPVPAGRGERRPERTPWPRRARRQRRRRAPRRGPTVARSCSPPVAVPRRRPGRGPVTSDGRDRVAAPRRSARREANFGRYRPG